MKGCVSWHVHLQDGSFSEFCHVLMQQSREMYTCHGGPFMLRMLYSNRGAQFGLRLWLLTQNKVYSLASGWVLNANQCAQFALVLGGGPPDGRG